MKFSYRVEGLHWGKRPLGVFLKLLVVDTVAIHGSLPIVDWSLFHLFLVDVQQEWPNQFSIDECLEPLFSAHLQKLKQTVFVAQFNLRIAQESYLLEKLLHAFFLSHKYLYNLVQSYIALSFILI